MDTIACADILANLDEHMCEMCADALRVGDAGQCRVTLARLRARHRTAATATGGKAFGEGIVL
eukprot:6931161-Pyramimonas_sp.AAC.1